MTALVAGLPAALSAAPAAGRFAVAQLAAASSPPADKVSPGVLGAVVTLALAVATVLLIRSMVGHLRKVRYGPGPVDDAAGPAGDGSGSAGDGSGSASDGSGSGDSATAESRSGKVAGGKAAGGKAAGGRAAGQSTQSPAGPGGEQRRPPGGGDPG